MSGEPDARKRARPVREGAVGFPWSQGAGRLPHALRTSAWARRSIRPTRAILSVLRALDPVSAAIQGCAARALGKLGPTATEACAALLKVAQTGDVAGREYAILGQALMQPQQNACK